MTQNDSVNIVKFVNMSLKTRKNHSSFFRERIFLSQASEDMHWDLLYFYKAQESQENNVMAGTSPQLLNSLYVGHESVQSSSQKGPMGETWVSLGMGNPGWIVSGWGWDLEGSGLGQVEGEDTEGDAWKRGSLEISRNMMQGKLPQFDKDDHS